MVKSEILAQNTVNDPGISKHLLINFIINNCGGETGI